ncbi:MAG: hypothetical protein NTX29_16640 [Actinobacteria bacterium]|nr:hypothetical protein [Actinomycetota bacterium]
MRRSIALLSLLTTLGLLASGCSTPPDTTSPAPVSYLWVVNSEGGTITGSGDENLTLTLTGVREYVTQFADRPVRHAYVLSTMDFENRWADWFSPVTPNAVLSFTEPASPMPASIVLEVTDPVYDESARTLSFTATRLHREPDAHPDAVETVSLPNIQTPATFISGALFIDGAEDEAVSESTESDPAATSPVPTVEASADAADPSLVPVAPDGSESPAPMLGAAAPSYRIGDTGPGGGIVFYDAGSKQPWGRFLEAAPAGWNDGAADPEDLWCGHYRSVFTSTEMGMGAANTAAMLSSCEYGAAYRVHAYAGGGLTDWFLPSEDELNALFVQRNRVGGFAPDRCYWSSTEGGRVYSAWCQFFTGWYEYNGSSLSKNASHGLRPVRAFS